MDIIIHQTSYYDYILLNQQISSQFMLGIDYASYTTDMISHKRWAMWVDCLFA